MNKNIGMASILFRPVCSECRKVLYEIIDCTKSPLLDEKGYKRSFLNGFTITPERCPFCGIQFDSVEIPIRLPFNNE